MATASDAITDALDSVLDDAGSQPDETSTPEATAKAEDVVAKAVEDATKSDKQPPSDEKTSAKEGKTVPYDRFSEVVGQKNSALERQSALEEQFKTSAEREDTLREKLGELESEHQILDAIRTLGKDPQYADAVGKIDRALQGIEEEVVEAETKGDTKALSDAEKRFSAKTDELEDMLASQRVDSLWDKASTYASSILDTLPEEYTDVDKDRLSNLWTPRVDWDYIEENGADTIPNALRESFAATIRDYGKPQGAVAKEAIATATKDAPEELFQTPEARVESIMSKNFSDRDEDGKAVHSDEEFSRDMASVLKDIHSGA